MKRLRVYLAIIVIILFIPLMGCHGKDLSNEKILKELQNIKFELIDKSVLPTGTIYTCKITNSSKYTIKQNNVYLKLPIKIEGGYKDSGLLIAGNGNKLNIKPSEQVVVSFIIPTELFTANSTIDAENPRIEMVGYLNELKQENVFSIGDSSKWAIRKN